MYKAEKKVYKELFLELVHGWKKENVQGAHSGITKLKEKNVGVLLFFFEN